jgi:hypothetical protein
MLSDLHIQAHEIIVQSGQTSPNVISPRFELIIKQFAKRFTKDKTHLQGFQKEIRTKIFQSIN